MLVALHNGRREDREIERVRRSIKQKEVAASHAAVFFARSGVMPAKLIVGVALGKHGVSGCLLLG